MFTINVQKHTSVFSLLRIEALETDGATHKLQRCVFVAFCSVLAAPSRVHGGLLATPHVHNKAELDRFSAVIGMSSSSQRHKHSNERCSLSEPPCIQSALENNNTSSAHMHRCSPTQQQLLHLDVCCIWKVERNIYKETGTLRRPTVHKWNIAAKKILHPKAFSFVRKGHPKGD